MPSEPAGAPTLRTWADLLPPKTPWPPLITREELIKRLADEGIAVTTGQLRAWQVRGILPYGVRRRHEGATRTLFPDWYVSFVRNLLFLNASGRSLTEAGAELRWRIRDGFFSPPPLPTYIPGMPDELQTALLVWARRCERAFGAEIDHLDIKLIDTEGAAVSLNGDQPFHFRVQNRYPKPDSSP